jgi:hypothetical protein
MQARSGQLKLTFFSPPLTRSARGPRLERRRREKAPSKLDKELPMNRILIAAGMALASLSFIASAWPPFSREIVPEIAPPRNEKMPL